MYPKFARRADDIDHASALDHYLTSIVVCRIDDLLDTVYVGSKRRNDDPVVLVLCKIESKVLPTVRSDIVNPGRIALVLSHISASTPFFQARQNAADPPVRRIPVCNRS